MRKLIILTILFLFTPTIQSFGQNVELGKNKIDLRVFPIDFNINHFYKNQIITHKKSLDLFSQGKTSEAFSEELLKDYKFVEKIDSVNLGNGKFLLLYIMKGMNVKDSLATFGNIRFQRLDMIANEKNYFQSLRAVSYAYKDNNKNFNALKNEVQKVYGEPKIIEKTFEHEEYYEWITKDFIINLIVDKEEESDKKVSSTTKLYLTNKNEYAKLKDKLFGKTKYYWVY